MTKSGLNGVFRLACFLPGLAGRGGARTLIPSSLGVVWNVRKVVQFFFLMFRQSTENSYQTLMVNPRIAHIY